MSGSIHKEALADAKKLREVAEENAKKAILEQISPTIKQMIEKELLGESKEMEEDVLLDPEEDEEEEEKEETSESVEDSDVQLTAESVEAMAKMAGMRAEHYGMRSIRIQKKLEDLHESFVEDVAYGEKLRQVKGELEKTYKELQEDKKNEVVPEQASTLIEEKLEELWETTNVLMVPVKVKLIEQSTETLSKKFSGFKTIANGYALTEGAQKRFGKECVQLTREAKSLLESVKELGEIAEDKSVSRVQKKVSVLFKEIYTMGKKFGSLNEEELKIVLSGLSTEDPEGSELVATVEPADDLGDDMDMDDDMNDMGGDELGDMDDEMEMDEYGMFEGEGLDEEEELDELGMKGYSAGGMRPRGRAGLAGGTARGMRKATAKDPSQAHTDMRTSDVSGGEETEMDELGGKSYSPGSMRPRGRAGLAGAKARGMRKADAAAEEKPEEKSEMDEQLEISEAMLKQELLRLRKRRAAVSEAMKAMQHSPGGGADHFDNFGGAGRTQGGGVEGDLFDTMDSDDLNDLDPVGTGYPVNESEMSDEEALDELGGKSYSPGSMRPRGRAGLAGSKARGMRKADAEKEKEDKKEDKVEEGFVKEALQTLKAYKSAINKLQKDLNESQVELRKSNLSNAKLVFATKLLQNENLSEKQRLSVVESLDEAKSVREVKKLYGALKEALEGKSDEQGQLAEGKERKSLGGSSRATKSGGTLISESEQKEFSRWGELAGFLGE